ncbi:PhnA domain-containing protein [Glaciecola siphonariae]|uniref:PhnA domain-containing protein n=1 Tax=Glaciecola siphonariae TaxID=521012 RepID=A0ABV9LY03_9ALTE
MQAVLEKRANGQCELCSSANDLQVFPLEHSPDLTANCAVLLCAECRGQISGDIQLNSRHFACLSQSMWSTTPAVQVLSYRLLHQFSSESWAQDALDMLYLDDETKAWADKGLMLNQEPTLDANGAVLKAGDSVTIIKDLDVKGANFTAKRGTPVRNIALSDNPLHIEGKVNGQRIVIIAAYTKLN